MQRGSGRWSRARQSASRNRSVLAVRLLELYRTKRTSRGVYGTVGKRFGLILLVNLAAATLLLLGVGVTSAVAAFTTTLPSVNGLEDQIAFKTVQIFDRNGTLLYEVNSKDGGKRTPVQIQDVSQKLIDATIATEDKDFYVNSGVDPAGIARAAYENFTVGQLGQGGSTITQQLAKNLLIAESDRTDKSYTRKLQEMALALRISQQYSKDDILAMYMNEVYYGHLAYGIEAASETYFGKPAKDLDLAEASLLAGLPQAPSQYDPLVNFQAAKDRQRHVLDRMVEQSYITPDQADQAAAEKLNLQKTRIDVFKAPHFVMYIRQLLEQEYGAEAMYRLGLRVTTTLDLNLNAQAEQAIQAHMDALAKQNANNAGLVALDPRTGQILAMVGSRDFNNDSIAGEVNMATAPRQPGSTIKPLEYAVAFMKGWGPETVITDDYTEFPNVLPVLPPYRPHNFDGKFDGAMTVRYALANSKNIPAVKTLMFDTIPDFLKAAGKMGITFENADRYGLSLALGAGSVSLLNMAGAYAALDNYGSYHKPTGILKVEDWQGNVLEQYEDNSGVQAIGPEQAYMITSILADNWARTPLQGPNSPLKLSIPGAAKTGSTDDYKDSWTIGYTPDLVTGVWVGNTDNKAMKEVTGSLGAARIWHDFMENYHIGKPVQEFTPPAGVVEYRLCVTTAQPATQECPETVTEVWPTSYTPEQFARIPGLPFYGPKELAASRAWGGKLLGETVNRDGWQLAPIPTPTPIPRR